MAPSPAPASRRKDEMSDTHEDKTSESSAVSMDLMSLVRLMVRHWRVTGPAAAVTFLLVVAALVLSSPTYAASASVALYSPPDAPEASDAGADPAAGENPFTRYGDLSVVADIMARRMDSDAERAALKAEGVSGYEVVANRLQRGPLVEVTGTGSNPAAAIDAAERVVAEFDAVLAEMQETEGADPEYFITSGPIEPPETAVAQVGSTLRTAIAALAVGGLSILGLAVVAEAFTRRRDAARLEGASPDSTTDVAAGPARGSADNQPKSSGPSRAAASRREAADDRPRPRSGSGRAAPKSGKRDAGSRVDTPNGSRRRAPRAASGPVAEHREATQSDWNRWLPSTGTSAPDNGHKKPTNDRGT
jgi:hypothetical protein